MAETFDRPTLLDAFRELGERAWRRGRTVEIAVYGGSALVLVFDWREATRDVDAVFETDKGLVRELAAELATARGWSHDWLNDGVKGFLAASDADERRYFGSYPSEETPGLRVFTASPAYLFAMKCRAMRLGGAEGTSDIEDILCLGRALGVATAAQALDLVAAYFPRRLIEPRTQFGIEELFPASGPDAAG